MVYTIVAFYKFVSFPDYKDWQEPLLTVCQDQRIWGTILLAAEGINGTISGSTPEAIATVLNYLGQDERFRALDTKRSIHDQQPFNRLKVRLDGF